MRERDRVVALPVSRRNLLVSGSALLAVGESGGGDPERPFDHVLNGTERHIPLQRIVARNPSPDAKQDVCVTCGVPLGPGVTKVGAPMVRLTDHAGQLIPAQADNHSYDDAGWLRWFALSAVIPSIGPLEERHLQLYLASCAATESTDAFSKPRPIGLAELLASDFDVILEVTNLRPNLHDHGRRYTASAREGLASLGQAEARSWARLHGLWRQGIVVSEWILTVRLRDESWHIHPDLRVSFHVAAFRSASGQGIATIRTDVIVENGWINGASPGRAYFYDARILNGTNRATKWSWTAPETLGDISIDDGQPLGTIRRSAGHWADGDQDRGLVVVAGTSALPEGTPALRILNRINATTARCFFHGAFHDRATRRGMHTIHAIGHPAFARFKKRVWWPREQDAAAYVAPFSFQGPPEHALKQCLIESKLIQNISASMASSGSTANLDETGSRPFACRNNGDIGDFTHEQGAPGANPDIGIFPSYTIEGLLHFNDTGARRIFENADLRQQASIFHTDATTWRLMRLDNGVDWGLHPAWPNPVRTTGIAYSIMRLIASHWGSMFYISYLVRGDLADMEGLIAQDQYSWLVTPMSSERDGYCGNQLTRHALNWEGGEYTDGQIGGRERPQNRSIAWAIRAAAQALAVMPESRERNVTLGWDKSAMRARWSNVQTAAKRLYVDHYTARDNDLGSTQRFLKDGPHFLVGYAFEKQWQTNMILSQLAHANELGVLGPDGMAFLRWYAQTPLGMITNRDVAPDWVVAFDSYVKVLDGRPVRTFYDVYRATARHLVRTNAEDNPASAEYQSGARTGDIVTMRLQQRGSASVFPNAQNYPWYVGSQIVVGNGSGTILGILGPNACRLRVDRPFGTGSQRLRLPPPAPGDGPPRGSRWIPADGAGGGAERDYLYWNYHVFAYLVDLEMPDAREGRRYLERLVRLAPDWPALPPHHAIVPRT